MFGFIKKLFGFGSADQTDNAAQAPYKIEVTEAANASTFKEVEVAPAKVKLRQPGQPKQGAKKPIQGKKPAGQKKPAQPKPQGGQKPAGNKPRGRRPKAKPATPQQ